MKKRCNAGFSALDLLTRLGWVGSGAGGKGLSKDGFLSISAFPCDCYSFCQKTYTRSRSFFADTFFFFEFQVGVCCSPFGHGSNSATAAEF